MTPPTLKKSLFRQAWRFLESCEFDYSSVSPVECPQAHTCNATHAAQYLLWIASDEVLDIGETLKTLRRVVSDAQRPDGESLPDGWRITGFPYMPNTLHSDPFSIHLVMVAPYKSRMGFSAILTDGLVWGFTTFGITTAEPAQFFARFEQSLIFSFPTEA